MNSQPTKNLDLPPEGRRRVGIGRVVLGYLLAAVFLAWVFHGIEFGRLFENVGRITWPLVVLGLLFDVLSYVCAGVRWSFLLQPLGRIGVVRVTQAVYAGLFLNEVLPMRVGELARAYLVSGWLSVGVLRVVPSMALERLFEGIWLAVGIGLTAIFVPLPKNLVRSADALGLIVLAGAAAFVIYVIWRRKRPLPEPVGGTQPANIRRRLGRAVRHLVRGFGEIGLTWNTSVAFGATFLMFAFQALCFWLMLTAYHIHLSFWAGAAVFLIIHFGTSLPNAPANIGAYQFFCVLGLQLFSVDKTLATGFSFVVFILLTLPLIGIGFIALGQSGLSLGSLRDRLRKAAPK
jgi:glycosyltransferase 2 family protein